MAGLDATGFIGKTLEEIKAEIADALKTNIASTLDTADESPIGQLVGVFSSQLRQVWELAEAVYSSQYPDSASGFSLTSIATITGTQREAASSSFTTLTVNVDPGTYAIGTLIAYPTGDPTARFANSEVVTNGGGVAANVGPIRFEAEDTGPIRANANTLVNIAEPVVGWNSIVAPGNATDAELGAEIESDAALRIRRELELQGQGGSTYDAIRADILAVADVEQVGLLVNDSDVTDANGLPPHSIEVVAQGGLDADIAQAIWEAKAAGIETYGSTTVTIDDSEGNDHAIKFSRPTPVPIYLIIDAVAEEDDWPAAADFTTEVQQVMADFGDEFFVGDDVIPSRLIAELFESVAGLHEVTSLKLGTAPAPVGTTKIVISPRELATIDTINVTVNGTFE